jgi:hypothetical protein
MRKITDKKTLDAMRNAEAAILMLISPFSMPSVQAFSQLEKWAHEWQKWNPDQQVEFYTINCMFELSLKEENQPEHLKWLLEESKFGDQKIWSRQWMTLGTGTMFWLKLGRIVDFEPYPFQCRIKDLSQKTKKVFG